MEPNFSMGCIIGEKGNDLEFDPQILSTKIWRKYYPRKKSRKDRHPRKTSAGRRTIAIREFKQSTTAGATTAGATTAAVTEKVWGE